jgi:hypothetical protein
MKAFKALKLEKTNVANKATVSFNSPGNYVAPYGKTVVRVSGRGASGNATTGGNYAGESYVSTNPTTGGNYAGESYVSTNPTTGGNYAGESYLYTNPTTGGNYAGESYLYTNPTTPGNTVPGTCVSTLYQYFTANNYTTYDEFPGPCSPLGTSGCSPWPPGGDYCIVYGYYTNPSSSNPPTPGNDVYTPYYNPTVPGNDVYTPYYNPTVPGNDNYTPYYNPTVPGNDNYTPYYNPTVPGNSGAPANIAGVTFPGGAADSVAPTVPPTATTLSYSPSGFSVTVPSGGYVNLDNI